MSVARVGLVADGGRDIYTHTYTYIYIYIYIYINIFSPYCIYRTWSAPMSVARVGW